MQVILHNRLRHLCMILPPHLIYSQLGHDYPNNADNSHHDTCYVWLNLDVTKNGHRVISMVRVSNGISPIPVSITHHLSMFFKPYIYKHQSQIGGR